MTTRSWVWLLRAFAFIALAVAVIECNDELRPFQINVDQAILDDLQYRLNNTRLASLPGLPGEWELGTSTAYMKEIIQYWRNDYDWRAQEAKLNALGPQFVANVEGIDIHFIHVRSKAKNAIPLIFIHGWPGSILECSKVLPLFTDENAEISFDFVCPSLPGYGFSEIPKAPGYNPSKIGTIFNSLMQKLGYTKYVAQGGDWGGMIVARMGSQHPENCVAIHTNFVTVSQPFQKGIGGFLKSVLGFIVPSYMYTERERVFIDGMLSHMVSASGYMHIQATKPLTVGYGLEDSPVGLAAYIIEKFREWSDCNGDVETRFTKDELLTNIMIYYVTSTITSSARLYYEAFHLPNNASIFDDANSLYVPVPTGVAIFPKEMMRPPRMWAEYTYNITRYTYLEKGGHFAALEEPQLLVEDVRAFIAVLPYLFATPSTPSTEKPAKQEL